jgi:hypothetical protein
MTPQNEQVVNTEEERKQRIAKDYLDSMYKVIAEGQREKLDATATPTILLSNRRRSKSLRLPIHSASYQYKNDTTVCKKNYWILALGKRLLCRWLINCNPASKSPGKIIALQQTFRFFQLHPQKVITGTGIGNFSSKLAFRATALKIAGDIPKDLLISIPISNPIILICTCLILPGRINCIL